MIFFCITFKREIDSITEHRFFCYALTKEEAIKRFCDTTGYDKSCIISIHIQRESEGIKWES